MGNCYDKIDHSDDSNTLKPLSSVKYSEINKTEKEEVGEKLPKKQYEETKREYLQEQTPSEDNTYLEVRFPIIRRPAPQFTAVGYHDGFKEIKLSNYQGKYILLFFFPFDFSQICHQEILTFSDKYEEFQKIGCEILGCSMDSKFVHQQYCSKTREEGGLQGLNFPLISDSDRSISTNYGVIISEGAEKGASYRATFIIDKKQILRHANINDLDANIEVMELLRIIRAYQFADMNGSTINQKIQCPFSKTPDQKSFNNELKISNNNSNIKNESNSPQKEQTKLEEPHVVQLARRQSSVGAPVQRRPSLQQNQLVNQLQQNVQQEKKPVQHERKRSILKKRTIFDRMGGEIQVKKFVDKFFQYVKEDSRINYYFTNINDFDRIKEHFALQLIQLMGGPQPMKKLKDLAKAHENLCIDDIQFDAFCEVLEGSLIEHGIDDEGVRELFIFIEPQRDQIVNRDRAKPLIERLGGLEKVNGIIDKEFEKILVDDRMKDVISTLDLNKLKQLQKDFYKVSFSSQGYKGKSMRDLYRQLDVHNAQFDIMLDNLNKAIKESNVEGGAGREFLILMEPSLSYKPAKGKENLYAKLGGEVAVEKIVTVLFNKVLQDNILKDFFKNADINKLRGNLKCFYCFAFGGPQKYTGKTLRDAHWHLELQDIQFDTFKSLFLDTLKDFKVPEEIRKDLEDFMEDQRSSIVSVIPTLSERLGGEQIVEKICDNFFDRVLTDKRVKQFFKNTNTDTLRRIFKNFIIAYMGGVNKYNGRTMKEAHQALNLDDMHFNVIKDHFMEAVKEQKIPLSIVNDVGRVLETFRGDIVVRHSSIHDIIGGDRNLIIVINQTLNECQKDNTLKMIFKNFDQMKLQEHLKQYITFLLGGPNNYTGRRLAVAHKPLRVTDQQFTLFVGYMMNSFQQLGIDSITISKINHLLEALRGEIIKRPPTLYERLGGDVAVPDAIVRFTQKIRQDKQLQGYFTQTDWKCQTSRLLSFFTMITGGPNTYDGQSLKDAHAKFGLSAPLFDQFKKLMKDTMFEMGAELNDISEVMNLIETLRIDIIGSKPMSIIDKLGGEPMVQKLLTSFFEQIFKHETLSQFFKKQKIPKLCKGYSDFIMTTLGGNKTRYQGKTIKDLHWKFNISNIQFNEYKGFFTVNLKDHGVESGIVKEIESFWESLRPQIVQNNTESDEQSQSD